MQWAVSQAAPLRRMHIRGDIVLHQHGGWASGGWMSDALIDGKVDAGPQQQFISQEHGMGQLEWGQLEYGFRRRPPSARRGVAHASLHQGRRNSDRAREAFS